MKSKLASGVLALLIAAAPSAADDIQWRASGAKTKSSPASTSQSIQLGAPRAWNGKPATVPPIKQTAFQPNFFPQAPVIRANGGEDELPGVVVKQSKPAPKVGVVDPEVIQVPPKQVTPKDALPPAYYSQPGRVTTLWGEGPMLGGHGACGPVTDCGECCPVADCGDCCGCPPGIVGPAFAGFGACYDRPRLWFSAEYLNWGFSEADPPPLVTVNPLGTPNAFIGNPYSPFTQVPLGGDNFFNAGGSGFRVAGGFWFTPRKLWGLDASYFFISRDRDMFLANGIGQYILTRPFINGNNGSWAPQDVANPANFTAGSVTVANETYLWGLDANFRRALFCGPRYHIDAFLGFRHIQLTDNIQITERLTAAPPGFTPTQFFIQDQFGTRNQFYGGQVGLEAEGHFFARWFVNGQFKVAFGSINQQVNINGLFASGPVGGAQTTFPTGVATAPSNVGKHTRSRFAVASEMNLKLGYELTPNWRIFVGYNLMYLTNTVRAPEQIDPVVFPGTLPSAPNTPATLAPRPAVLFRTSGFVAQGVNVGLEGRW